MKICVVGAGSIGGLLGVKLALAGEDVTLIARGEHLRAIRDNGLRISYEDGSSEVASDVKATSDMRACGPQDLVILGLKAHQIEPVVDDIRALFGPDTMVLTIQNGLPWWYFQRHGGEFDGYRIDTLDADGRLTDGIEARRIIGCIAYPAATIVRPGVIRHIEGTRFPVGELDGSQSERVQRVSETLIRAGFKSPVLTDIRSEIWLKAWGNLSFNPISALCHATLVDICRFGPTRELAANMMTEAQTIAGKLGVTFRVPLEKRIAGAEKVGKHKTSMLQDVEAGRALETEALIGAVLELGRLTDTPTPYIGAIYAAVKLLGRTIEAESVFVKARALTPPVLSAVPVEEPALVGTAAG
ncbi:MAG: 2-dehydropantoate 2-reductase [Gammaproteobacteria bacterium]|nr:MAG: 2-dehydropantoate 2-reductase [Gammaproteobacteria bacterium]